MFADEPIPADPEYAASIAHLASANGHVDVLQWLQERGHADAVRSADALLLAAANGRLGVVRYLYERVYDLGSHGHAAIRAAVLKNHTEVVRYLHEQGCDLAACGDVAARLPLKPGNQPTIEYLASQGICPQGPQLLKLIAAIRGGSARATGRQFRNIDTAPNAAMLLGVAAEVGKAEIVRLLHANGCDIRAEEDLALRVAAACGHVDLVRELHQKGADLHACDGEALRWAAENGHLPTVRYLVEQGADMSKLGSETAALIQLNGDTHVFNYLTDCGYDSISHERPTIEAMREELYAARPVYRPSKLWEHFNNVNMEQLRLGGLEAFKRTINQNYFNFVPYSLLDPQLLRLIKWWITHPTLTPFRIKAVDPDIDPHTGGLYPMQRRIFRLNQRRPLLSYFARKMQLDLYGWLVSLLWDYVRSHDRLGLLNRVHEPGLGKPIESYIDGRLVSQDLAHSVLECTSVLGEIDSTPGGGVLRIAEVGAGYGRLGYVLLHATACRYFVFDIPPGLFVSQWYLSQLFPERKIFRFRHFERFEDIAAELDQCDVAFFAANQIELIPERYFDVTINISSLHELRPDQIDNMLDQIYRVTRSYVYLKQYKEYINPYDGLRILEDSYKLASGWRHTYYRDDPVDARFFETLIQSPTAPSQAAGAVTLPPPAPALRRRTVSVLLATYNHAEYLATSLAGICGQNRPADEIIIVDDGSTDGTLDLLQDYATKHGNIRILANGRNRGQHYSIQRALLAATGDYVVWASADDLLLPEFLERSCGELERHPEAGLCFSRLAVFVDGETGIRTYTGQSHGAAFEYGTAARHFVPAELARILRKHYLWMSGNTVVARRAALLEQGGFQRALRWHADWFAYYAIALRYGACVIPETLALMRERRATYSATGIRNRAEQDRVLRAILDAFTSLKYADIGRVLQRSPSLLSPFGRQVVLSSLKSPRYWLMAARLFAWHGARFGAMKYGRMRYRCSSAVHRCARHARHARGGMSRWSGLARRAWSRLRR